ncbi:MAG: carbohydrate ABC transporter permease [Hespellia sp.]|nr:carbohydrate ABC transporter permease [Hespellia sp.]
MNPKSKKKLKKGIGSAASVILMILLTVIVLFPIYWLVVTSFKMESEIYQIPPSLFPKNLTFDNYLHALVETKLPQYFLNSIIYTVGTLLVALLCGALAAYAMSRFRFKGKKTYLLVILLSQLMPMTTLIVPLYVSFGKMNLLNNRVAMIIVYAAIQIPIAIWLLIGYFNGIPKEIDEAAIMDGCTRWQILTKIVLPLAKPGLMAVGLSIAISVWQELMLAMTFTNQDELRPLMAGVSAAITKSGVQWGQITATGVLALLPMLIVFIFCQKYLIQGLTGGAVKG